MSNFIMTALFGILIGFVFLWLMSYLIEYLGPIKTGSGVLHFITDNWKLAAATALTLIVMDGLFNSNNDCSCQS